MTMQVTLDRLVPGQQVESTVIIGDPGRDAAYEAVRTFEERAGS